MPRAKANNQNPFFTFNTFWTSVTKAVPQKIITKPTDMAIHWKALKVHFLMVPLKFSKSFIGKLSRIGALSDGTICYKIV
jgi:hypothetical protein